MAYVTGVATSATDLKTAIINAATASGWTEVATDIINTGSLYFQLSALTASVRVEAGLGVSGSALTTTSGKSAEFRHTTGSGEPPVLSFPLTYHIHINATPDDIVVFVNYEVAFWQWMTFGAMKLFEGDGTGSYFCASGIDSDSGYLNTYRMSIPTYSNGSVYQCPIAPFVQSARGQGASINEAINIYGTSWSIPLVGIPKSSVNYQALHGFNSFLLNQPNSWNAGIVLKRMIITELREGSFYSYVAEMPHIRVCRNDNYIDGEELILGGEIWKIYPTVRKNSAQRNGTHAGTGIDHSGTLAIAVRKVT